MQIATMTLMQISDCLEMFEGATWTGLTPLPTATFLDKYGANSLPVWDLGSPTVTEGRYLKFPVEAKDIVMKGAHKSMTFFKYDGK